MSEVSSALSPSTSPTAQTLLRRAQNDVGCRDDEFVVVDVVGKGRRAAWPAVLDRVERRVLGLVAVCGGERDRRPRWSMAKPKEWASQRDTG